MLSFLPPPLKGTIAATLFALNTLFWTVLLLFVAVFKLLIPIKPVRDFLSKIMVVIAEAWIWCNVLNQGLTQNIEIHVQGLEGLSREKSYLVISNHRSWVDIVILQRVLNRKIPFMRFFLKQQLIWVPLLGLAWWALDMPFMKRYTKEQLRKNPAKRGSDLEATRRSCEKLRGKPASILNFVEGTRFTPAKRERQNSPFRHLLSPKAGGVAFVLQCMGTQFDALVDVTIAYPGTDPTLWKLMAGQVPEIHFHVRRIEIPNEMRTGNYLEDPEFRVKFQAWLKQIWVEKDEALTKLLGPAQDRIETRG